MGNRHLTAFLVAGVALSMAPAAAQLVPHPVLTPAAALPPPVMVPPVAAAAGSTAAMAGSRAANAASSVGSTVADTASSVGSAASSVGSSVAGAVSSAGGTADGVASDAEHAAKSATGTLEKTVRDATNDTRDSVGRTADPKLFEQDTNGARVLRGEVLCLSPTEHDLSTATALHFQIATTQTLRSLGLSIAILRAPAGMSATDALKALRESDPSGTYDYDHVYDPTGSVAAHHHGSVAAAPPSGATRIGMIDGGVDSTHPAFRASAIQSRSFAGTAMATEHGTAVASLLVGHDGDFQGALSGATLYAADVYGGSPAGGSADDIARALAWLAAQDVPVTNISLAGPPNAILAAATSSFVRSGHVLVAAVGNDGPAAPQRYPAAYPGVVGVTSVDEHRSVEIDANRGPDVAFAARGVAVRAATMRHDYASVTGTSFAAPVVAARFALLVGWPDPSAVARAWKTLEHAAVGARGRDSIVGYGYLDRPHANSTVAVAGALPPQSP
ncbi:MAG: S8 family serine peptidase [Alphaproteobacteria bacterium]|nr:S8 family serine peptidase [Alphaproteobacteria bacterium]